VVAFERDRVYQWNVADRTHQMRFILGNVVKGAEIEARFALRESANLPHNLAIQVRHVSHVG
jgi:hypothetical protein